MSLRKSATAGMVWTFTEHFGNQLIGFIISVILARILLPEEFGLIGMIAVFIGIGNALLNGGLNKSLIRGKDIEHDDYSTVFFFNFFSSILIYCLIFFLAPFIAEFYDREILVNIIRVYCLGFIISGTSSVQSTMFTKSMNFRTQAVIAIPSAIIGGVTGIFLALNGYGVWSLVYSSLVTSFMNSSQLWYYSNWYPTTKVSFEKFKFHFNYGYKLTISELLDRIFQNAYLIVIGKYFSATQVGFYTRAETMNQLPVKNLSRALDKVTFPLFVKIQQEEKMLKDVYRRLMCAVLFVVTPTMIFLAVLAEPIFRFLFTDKWLPAVPYFQILCVTGILYPLHSYNLSIINVKGRSDLFLKLEILKKILIFFTLIVTLPYGIEALLYGQVFISVTAFFINSHYTGQYISYPALKQLWDISPVIILSFFSGVLLYFTDLYFKSFLSLDFLRISIGGFVMFSFYLGFSKILKFDSLKEILKFIKGT